MKLNKERLWNIINPDKAGDKLSKYFDIFIFTLIILNTFAVIISTIHSIEIIWRSYLYWFEVFSITIFTIEYLLRIWLCTQNKKYESPILGRLHFMFTFYAFIDLIAIAPFYIPFFAYDLRFIRLLRLFRIVRILKLERYTSAMSTIKKVFRSVRSELIVVGGAFTIISLISSVIIYYIENPVQPHIFTDITDALWWSIGKLTTVGSDMFPVTPAGKTFSSLISILGIGMIALPTSIITVGLSRLIIKKFRIKKCPHCGKNIKYKI